MSEQEKLLSNPFSSGGGGHNFEVHIQTFFTLLMLAGGVAPCLPPWPIKKIKLQGKHEGFNTDDCILFVKEFNGIQEAKLLVQIKHIVSITESDKTFGEVIHAAWNDFCDPQLFDRKTDEIALVTGPLSASDNDNARIILEWARHSENANEFISKVERTNFSNDLKREKLNAFRVHLRKAKKEDISNEELYEFMKKFNLLGSDLDIKNGINISLLRSLINQFLPTDPQRVWTLVVDEVQYANQNAGTLSPETISSEIRKIFIKPKSQVIPVEFVKKEMLEIKADLSLVEYGNEVAFAMLLGAWDESVENDKRAAEKLSSTPYDEWIVKLRNIVIQPKASLVQKNHKWKVIKRLELWKSHGPRIFDEHLDRFKEIVVNVLREPDPKFELPKEEHFAARVRGKIPLHSESLRNGLSESLALLGSHPKALSSCSLHKPEAIAAYCVREVLENADWVVWASLNDVLPLLAEASPNEFLSAIEKKLNNKQGEIFRSVFGMEGGGFGGWNYMTGTLWGLEIIAWHPDYLARAVVLLGQLAELDPGGNWANRPINSLTTIFLPWLPQTTATIEKRMLAVKALLRECPRVGWKLLLTLLPNTNQITTGSQKPKWQEFIPKDQIEKMSSGDFKITNKDYFEQIGIYSTLAVQNAKDDIERLEELIDRLDNLPKSAYLDILNHLSSAIVVTLPEDKRLHIWEALTGFVSKHRKFSDANWALPAAEIDKIAGVADLLQPSSPSLIHRRLFGSHELDLYEEKGNYEEQRQKMEKRRIKAVEEIFEASGIEGIVNFSKSVELPRDVGFALGSSSQANQDAFFLPTKLTTEEAYLKDLTYGYLWNRFHTMGWEWADKLNISDWTDQQKAAFFVDLPFVTETWRRVKELLGKNESLYWKFADARPYRLKEELREAVKKLLQYGRPRAAIQCLKWMLYEKINISIDQVYQALFDIPTLEEPQTSLAQYEITELIEWLQNNPQADEKILSDIEWIYIRLLDHHFGHTPKTLERRLANDPIFFCEIIKTAFRSEKPQNNPKELTEDAKQLATLAYELLFKWQTAPGTKLDGSFDTMALKNWLKEVKNSCESSGHLKIALQQVGKVLAHSKPDPDGLWIHKTAAEVLNEKDAEEMRSGFCIERYNMRGVFWGTEGRAEKEIAQSYREKADAVDKEGYFRFATSLRNMAASYDRDAEREASRDPFDA